MLLQKFCSRHGPSDSFVQGLGGAGGLDGEALQAFCRQDPFGVHGARKGCAAAVVLVLPYSRTQPRLKLPARYSMSAWHLLMNIPAQIIDGAWHQGSLRLQQIL